MFEFTGMSKLTSAIILLIFLSACGSGDQLSSSDLEGQEVTIVEKKPVIDLPKENKPSADLSEDGYQSQVLVEWLDNSDNESGFIIERRLERESSFSTLVMLPENTIAYTDKSKLLSESVYCYRVSAFNQSGRSSSDEVCVETLN